MRQLTADLFTTLDGFASGDQAPAYFGYLGPDLQRWIDDELGKPQVILMGRLTYEAMATISRSGAYEDASRMTDVPKVVFSHTLREPLTWSNTRLISSELGPAIRSPKEQPGDQLRTIGSPSLVTSLLRLGLVDRFRLVVFPQILGASGREPIFADLPDLDLELVEAKVLDSRLLVIEYRPAG